MKGKHNYRRSKENINNNNKNVCDKSQSQQKTEIEIDSIIEKHSKEIRNLKVINIIITIIISVLHIWVTLPIIIGKTKIISKIVFFITVLFIAVAISFICIDFVYKLHFKRVIKSINYIKNYEIRRRKPKILKKILKFNVPIYSSSNTDITEIEIENTTVIASQLNYSKNKYPKKTITEYEGECYSVEIKNQLTTDGIWLVCGEPSHIKKSRYSYESEKYTIYAETEEAINNYNIKNNCNIGRKICNALYCRDFTLYFEKNNMYYIEQKLNKGFDLYEFDFNIEKSLRRDLEILNKRIKLAKVLVSACIKKRK